MYEVYTVNPRRLVDSRRTLPRAIRSAQYQTWRLNCDTGVYLGEKLMYLISEGSRVDHSFNARGMTKIVRMSDPDTTEYIPPAPKCTCGAEKTYGAGCRTHSSWCDIADTCNPPPISTGIYPEESDT